MKLIRLLFKRSRLIVLLAMLTSLVSGASTASLIALINRALDPSHSGIDLSIWNFLGLCGLILMSTVTSQVILVRLAQQIVFDSEMDLIQQILACPLRHVEELGKPRLLVALTEDIDAISRASAWVASLGLNIALVTGCFIYLSWLSPPTFACLLVFIGLSSYSYQYMIDRGTKALKDARETRDQLFEHFRSVVEGTKELKLNRYRRQAFLSQDLKATASSFEKFRIKAMTFFAVGNSWALVLFFVAIGLLFFGVSQLTLISTSVMSSYALTIIFMINPLRGILNALPQLSQANIALTKIESLGLSLSVQIEEQETSICANLQPISSSHLTWNTIKLVELTYTYRHDLEGHSFTLGPINIDLKAQQIIFIVGGNGSGKSTLVKLLTGLYIPEQGYIQTDQTLITAANREQYRQNFSVVFSDYYLFRRLLGIESDALEHDLDQKAHDYLLQLQLAHKVQIQSGILSSTDLSQGQRKRLALLSAFLEDRPVYVFDEWASDQDPVFKRIFYTQLIPELKQKQKTVFVISHDDRYFDIADRKIRMEDGQIVHDSYC